MLLQYYNVYFLGNRCHCVVASYGINSSFDVYHTPPIYQDTDIHVIEKTLGNKIIHHYIYHPHFVHLYSPHEGCTVH